MIVDEAHRLKNFKSALYQELSQVWTIDGNLINFWMGISPVSVWSSGEAFLLSQVLVDI